MANLHLVPPANALPGSAEPLIKEVLASARILAAHPDLTPSERVIFEILVEAVESERRPARLSRSSHRKVTFSRSAG